MENQKQVWHNVIFMYDCYDYCSVELIDQPHWTAPT